MLNRFDIFRSIRYKNPCFSILKTKPGTSSSDGLYCVVTLLANFLKLYI